MKKAFVLALVMLFAISGVANAAAPEKQGTLAIDTANSSLTYKGGVRFNWTASGYKGYEYPMVVVACSQPDNPYRYTTIAAHPTWVYAQLDHPQSTFILGGGSSAWVSWVNEDPTDAVRKEASCEATLYLYPASVKHPPVSLDSLTFTTPS